MGEAVGGPYNTVPDWPGRDASNSGHARITAFLVLDIQQSREKAEAVRNCILRQIAADQGKPGENEIVMNAYIVCVGKDFSVIEPAFEETGEATIHVRTADLLAAIDQRIADIKRAWHP